VTVDTPGLTLYYDGACPFCAASMAQLRAWNRRSALAFIDIRAEGFDAAPLGVTMAALDRELHGMTADGRLLVGVDCIEAAYTLAGQGWRVALLRMKPLRPVLAALYRKFALHRYRISGWLGYAAGSPCKDGVCTLERP
jgi:predicted DCC family thiol-disulfide oxidoreductase YuxK